jgi:light-regulated signal transduction histidine kinase (bacteriophytochrome)
MLETRYAEALASYFETGDEGALSVAYEIGRRAIGEGLGILDVVAVHRQITEQRGQGPSVAERVRRSQQSGDFLREALSPFEMSFRGYREANDQLLRLNQQLTEQRDALDLVNRELESFSYSVSHDLRAPLRSIGGFSEALLTDCAGALGEDGKKYLRYIREAASEMAQLIEGLLRLARVTRADLSRSDVDVSALARHVAARLQAGAPSRKVEIVIQDDVHGLGDGPLLGVVVENLLGNAWKFTAKRQGARIELGCSEVDGRLAYFVRDNGAGFDMAHASKLFGTFQRLHAQSEFEGSGIGLATVQRIVRRHGGQIWAEGEVGRGAVFYFTLGPGSPGARG